MWDLELLAQSCQFDQQFGLNAFVLRVVVDAGQFIGIALEIKELPIVQLLTLQPVIVNQFVIPVRHTIVPGNIGECYFKRLYI